MLGSTIFTYQKCGTIKAVFIVAAAEIQHMIKIEGAVQTKHLLHFSLTVFRASLSGRTHCIRDILLFVPSLRPFFDCHCCCLAFSGLNQHISALSLQLAQDDLFTAEQAGNSEKIGKTIRWMKLWTPFSKRFCTLLPLGDLEQPILDIR